VLTEPEMDRRLRALDVVTGWIEPAEFRAFTEGVLRQWQELSDELNLYVTG
jgi:hypothetical protein